MKTDNYNTAYLSYNSKIDERYHRRHWILHKDFDFYLAEFDTEEHLRFFAETLGFTYELKEERTEMNGGTYKEFKVSHYFKNEPYFCKREEVPAEARPVKLLSNGSIVTGYVWNDGTTIHIYRPNPNAKEVYKPMTHEDHIAYQKVMGMF